MNTQSADIINGIFVFSASFFYAINVYKLMKDKQVKGYTFSSLVFFCAWNIWNAVFFLTSTDFFWSKVSSITCAAINTTYLLIAYRYKDE